MNNWKNLEEYKEFWLSKIKKERKAQIEKEILEIKNLPAKKREQMGKCIRKTKLEKVGKLLDLHIYKAEIPQKLRNKLEINVGDVVLISKRNPLKGTTADVYRKKQDSLLITTTKKIAKGYYRIDLFVNEITFKRMEEALNNINEELSSILLMKTNIKTIIKEIKEPALNKDQEKALSLSNTKLLLIHGPPGTGKTTTLSYIIKHLVKSGKKVLATADSNNAVDNLGEKLKKLGLEVTRIGNPSRVEESLIKQTLSYKITTHPLFPSLNALNESIEKIRKEQKKYIKPTPSTKRGLSKEEIIKLSKNKKTARGLSLLKIKSMAKWYECQEKINELAKIKAEKKKQIEEEIIRKSDVIISTNSGSYSEVLKDIKFDSVVVDEACQSTEPSTLMALTKAHHYILAGDPKQLPPTVISKDKDLSISLFERLSKKYKPFMLTIQYRMNKKINDISSKLFYGGKLKPHKSVMDISLKEFGIKGPISYPLLFINTEGKEKGKKSKYNIEELENVKTIFKLLSKKIGKEKISILTPYKEQRYHFLKSNLPAYTIDGFQGRENEVIILSLVRSNEEKKIGFLKDERRFNTAITRAKRQLIVVGNKETLSKHRYFSYLIEKSKELSIDEYKISFEKAIYQA